MDAQTISTDVGKVLEDLPLAVSTIQAAQADVATGTATHESIAQQGLAVAGTVGASLNALAASGTIGHNDAANITNGVTVVESVTGLVAEFDALVAKIKAAFSWL